MKIGLISDTHVPESFKEVPVEVIPAFVGVDLILHAGDLHAIRVLDWLEQIAPVIACRGNGDNGGGGRPYQPEDPRMKETQVIEVDGFKIGLLHDLPLPEMPPYRTMEGIMHRNFGGPVDIIVCGDTHVANVEVYKDILIVNPGSPTLPNNLMPQLGTVGILEIGDGRAEARIVSLAPGDPD